MTSPPAAERFWRLPVTAQSKPVLNLGNGVYTTWTAFGGHDKAGLTEYHYCGGKRCLDRGLHGIPGRCAGSILFDLPGMAEAFPNRELWQVISLDPLSLHPSIHCACPGCTHSGWIRGGMWIKY